MPKSKLILGFLIVLMGGTGFSIPVERVSTGAELWSKVESHCKSKICACYANSMEGLQLTFGNGSSSWEKALIKVQPDYQFAYRQNEMLSLAEADSEVSAFKLRYGIDSIGAKFCHNSSENAQGINEFLYNVRSTLLDLMFYEQLRQNGGFCNQHQKCECEFSLGGNEIAPDFAEAFEIGVSGEQQFIYTGGSSAGQISPPQGKALVVRRLGAMVGKSKSEKVEFVEAQLRGLEVFAPVCRDLRVVRNQGRESLLRLIEELENPSAPDEGEGH